MDKSSAINYPKVSIIILNWNGLEDTMECLESLRNLTYPNYEVIVVDNASEGDDVKVLREKFGEYIHLIENDDNYGFARGNNIGIRYCLERGTDYIFLLNNDTIVDADFLGRLVEVAETDEMIGIASPMIYWYNQPDKIQFGGRLRINLLKGTVTAMKEKEASKTTIGSDVASGAAMLIKKTTVERIGLLPEEYFFGVEDRDYCLRSLREGLKIMLVPAARIWHKGARARNKIGFATIKYDIKGRQTLRRKYMSTPGFIVSTPFFLAWTVVQVFVRSLILQDWQTLRAFPKMMLEGLKGVLGR